MSSSACATILKNLGGAHKVLGNSGSAGGSGSNPHREEAAECAAPQAKAVDVDNVETVIEVEDDQDDPFSKKRKIGATKTQKRKDLVIDPIICDTKGKAPDGEPVRVRTFTLQDLASSMSEISSDEDWVNMEGSGLSFVLKKVVGNWGFVSLL